MSWISSLRNYFLSPVASSLIGSRVFLGTLLSNIVNLLSSRNSRDQLSRLYKRTGRIIIPYNETGMFLDSKEQDKRVYSCEKILAGFPLHACPKIPNFIYEGWNFNFGNTPPDWIQGLLEWRANAAGRMGPSPTYIRNGSGPSRNGHRQ